jgi:hypothetical protein
MAGFGQALRGEVMDITQITGFVAGFGTTFAALPDLIAMLKRRSSVGMNREWQLSWALFKFSG